MSVRLGKISFFTIILFLIFIYNGNDWLRQLENNLPSKIVIDGKKSLTIQNAKGYQLKEKTTKHILDFCQP